MSCDNKKSCPCTFSCGRHGKCCECVEHHRKLGEFTACFFSAEAEKTGDRSFKKLVEDRK